MIFENTLHDPLSINLPGQMRILLSTIPSTSQHYGRLISASNPRQLLDALSTCLAAPSCTAIIAKLFRPLLMDLCARWIDDSQQYEDHLVALSFLVEVHEELFPILNRLLLTHFEGGPLASPLSPMLSWADVNSIRLHRILLAYYRILQVNRELPHHFLWPLAPLSEIISSQDLDNGTRFLAIRCYSLQSGMGEAERLKLERKILGEPCREECRLNYGQNLDGTEDEVDGWLLPAVELNRVREERREIAKTPIDFYTGVEMDEAWQIQSSDISPWIANVHGVLSLRSSNPSIESNSPLIPTPSSTRVLQQLAIQVSLCLPTLLTSAPSAGKTSILSHLAKVLHPENASQIITIQLADSSLDPRSLLGSYISSTAHSGTFEWKEGVLIRSMREGKWVVFEDVDRGSSEVLGIIKPLAESLELGKWIGGRAKLNVPSRGTVIAHESFRMFATRSSHPARDGAFIPPTFFGSQWFSEVVVPTPSPEELFSILNAKFPRLAGNVSSAIIRLWDAIRQLGLSSSGLEVGLRELLKFCSRIDSILPSHDLFDNSAQDGRVMTLSDVFSHPNIREDIYMEARDVFFGIGTPTILARAHLSTIAQLVGEHLGLDSERQHWILSGKSPQFSIDKDANGRTVGVTFGRTHLPARSNKAAIQIGHSRPFAMHKPAIGLLSRIATAVSHSEPVLLTGETGTGKTSVISHLASVLHQPLISLNLSHQTESSDLIGGLKPIDARIPATSLQEKFTGLFAASFSRKKNEKFETEIRKAVSDCKWKRAVGLWKESVRLAVERIRTKQDQENPSKMLDDEAPRKRRKTVATSLSTWTEFLHEVEVFEIQHVHGKGKFAFGFVEGPLVKALKSGCWLLLDEINLASSDTLEYVSSLLQDPTCSITLTEHGSLEPITRHPNFRLFACMNPATDVGKKDLPPAIRSRFTEIDVPSPDSDRDTLLSIISQYIAHAAVSDKKIIMDIADFYVDVKRVAENRQLADGTNHRPHFSMRTLIRALSFASDIAASFGLRRSVWEGCLMAFTMTLDAESEVLVMNLAKKYLLSGTSNPHAMLTKEPLAPTHGHFVKFGPFHLEQGPFEVDPADDYIITPSVAQKLIDLSRVILTRRFPVLIEGPTSSGKTSAIEYLCRRTGHRFIRINNHEHTDIQEYFGSYVSDPLTGKLVYKDGLLVQALRLGHWLVLDELNLAPTDVLEALNRLLDDNRELVIPETQEVVRPHPHFMLFATQNPPGVYAGRKILSRAFRNRFLEVHFKDVPQEELEAILCQRCRIAPSYAKRIVSVFRELQKRRQTGRVFESKHGFATLRDLFRWANRDAVGYQELANNGFMLLAERARRPEDKRVVKEVIEKEIGVKIDEDAMYNLQNTGTDIEAFLGNPLPKSADFVWTSAMKRLYTLVCRSLRFQEPVLLVGETGTGKTSICQIFAEASSRRLLSLNCHQNTETADIIGGLRPVRNRNALQADPMSHATSLLKEIGIESPLTVEELTAALSSALKARNLDPEMRSRVEAARGHLARSNAIFEWHDGPLVDAMRNGHIFLMDEISLADDSILERLNSVLEHGRSIVLAERGGTDSDDPFLRAADNFSFVATMNPGGDYGKKELSPALRNRFTEIWVSPVNDRQDLELIVSSSWKYPALQLYTSFLLDFIDWLCARVGDRSLLSLRDILAWVSFLNSMYGRDGAHKRGEISLDELFHHGAHMTYLDGLGSFPQLAGYSKDAVQNLKSDALIKLQDLVPLSQPFGTIHSNHDAEEFIQLGSFAIPRGSFRTSRQSFNFTAPTTFSNAMRVIRACQIAKPTLLEGSPGVGKTSLISALANLSGHKLCRINLSDQTDLIDLFGSDLPSEGGEAGQFAWKDAEFLRALQDGDWVLLDEMNLAPQAVLEGLNAVLDHRGAVYIPELNRTFKRHPSFRIFGAQNPIHQGGGRKGLPKSFLNRFTKVYLDELTPDDFLTVAASLFPDLTQATLRSMISFSIDLNDKVGSQTGFAQDGSPWELNLRDVIRWCMLSSGSIPSRQPKDFLGTVYLHRFRSRSDRQLVQGLFDKAFSVASSSELHDRPPWSICAESLQFGCCVMDRRNQASFSRPRRILKTQLGPLESLGICVSQAWLAIITGPRKSGKTSLVRALADLTGNSLQIVAINPGTDTMDILGSVEQVDSVRILANILDEIICLLEDGVRSFLVSKEVSADLHLANTLRRECDKISASLPTALTQTVLQLIRRLHADDTSLQDRYQAMAAAVRRLLEHPSGSGQFEWVDGPLIKAMKSGQWLVLDGANLGNPSVLDRLNSLCEHEGYLALSERGFVNGEVQVIKPHPRFRLFMTADPQYGELSRAMRNRGIEVYLPNEPIGNDSEIVSDFNRLPTFSSGHPQEVQAASYDAIRRGILVQDIPISSTTSTGHSLDHDSALTYLIDAFPVGRLPTHSVVNLNPWVFFLSRTLVPAYTPYLRRYVNTRFSDDRSIHPPLKDYVAHFPHEELSQTLLHYRQSYCLWKHISLDSVLYQPMNFYWNEGLLQNRGLTPDIDGFLSHLLVSEVLNLGAAIYLYQQDARLNKIVEHSTMEKDCQIRLSVIKLLEGVTNVGLQILHALRTSTSDLSSARLASSLLSTSCHLRKAVNSPIFDFSAMYAISNWFHHTLRNSDPLFVTVVEQLEAFHKVALPSTGLGLITLWSRLFLEETPSTTVDAAAWTDRMASSLGGFSGFALLRRQAFDVISLETFTSLGTRTRDLTELRGTLNKHLNANVRNAAVEHADYVDPQSSVLELSLLYLSFQSFDSKILKSIMQEVANLVSYEKKVSLVRILPLQHLVWVVDAGASDPRYFTRAQIAWIEGLWKARVDNNISGPSIFCHPVLLQRVIETCDVGRVQLRNLTNHDKLVRDQVQISLIISGDSADRFTQLACVLFGSLSSIASSYAYSYEPATFEAIQGLASRGMEDFQLSFRHALGLLQQTTDKVFAEALDTELNHIQSRPSDLPMQLLGLAWIGVGRLILHLSVPDSPVDPAVIQNTTYDLLRRNEEDLRTQIHLHEQLEQLVTGNARNDVTEELHSRLLEIQLQLGECSDTPQRRVLPRLHLFWSEVSQFTKSVLDPTKLSALLDALLVGQADAITRETVLQESLSGFYRRLDTVYPEFSDINVILKLAILYIRLGAGILTNYAVFETSDSSPSKMANFLLPNPSVRSSSKIIYHFEDLKTSSSAVFLPTLLAVSASSAEIALGTRSAAPLSLVDIAYEQAVGLWHIDRAKETDWQKDMNSLYRSSTSSHHPLSDAQIEEEEFLAMFPTFENAFEVAANSGGPNFDAKRPLSRIQASDAISLLHIHFALTDSQIASRSAVDPFNNFRELRGTAIRTLLQQSLGTLPATLDYAGAYLQLNLLHETLQDLTSEANPRPSSYNFYADPNYRELKRASFVIEALRQRLEVISEEWPDQMVLRHLMEKCDYILGVTAGAPVAKMLSMIEQLLEHTDDWETYANRNNSINSNREELVRLVVDWRRLELSCWQTLLDSQSTAFANEISFWWFRLYDAVVRGPLSASQETTTVDQDPLQAYVESLIPLLDDFMQNGPLGQFHVRLRLLHSFERYTSMIIPVKTTADQATIGLINRILHSTCSYFDLFSESLQKHLDEQKGLLETEVKGFIKLASWKDVNVQALKQSARKTHYQLYKIVRKYRDVLRHPIRDRLLPFASGETKDCTPYTGSISNGSPQNGSLKDLHSSPVPCSLSHGPLIDLRRRCNKFRFLIYNHITPFIKKFTADLLDEFAVEIITTSKRLAELLVPSTLTGDLRERHIKALQVRKRKAWSDLLRELKLAGLKSNLKPDILRQNTSQAYVRRQDIMPRDPELVIEVDKGEIYFLKLSGSLPVLRAALPSHHSDLTTRDIQKGVAFLECGFSMAIDLRSRFAVALDIMNQLQRALQRLKVLENEETVIPVIDPRTQLIPTADLLCKINHALREFYGNVVVANGLGLHQPAPNCFLDDVLSAANLTKDMHSRLIQLLDDLSTINLPCLTKDEYDLVTRAQSYKSRVVGMVLNWSEQFPLLQFLLMPLLQWLEEQAVVPLRVRGAMAESNTSNLEQLINSLLVCVQTLASRSSKEDKDDSGGYLLEGYTLSRDFTHLLHLSNVHDQLRDVCAELSSRGNIKEDLLIITSFLDPYLLLAREQLSSTGNWTKTLLKFDFVLCSLLQSLCQQGFCRPLDTEDDGQPSGDALDATEGIGIGDGQGIENVGKDIEDASQIEGLRGEEEKNDKEGAKEDSDAIEMPDDFGGDLRDVSEDGSEDVDQSDDGEEPEFDETLGDLDPLDPSTLDEKMWDDGKSPEDSGAQEGKSDASQSIDQSGPSEVMAKEGQEKEGKKGSTEERQELTGVEATDHEEEIEPEAVPPSDPTVNGAPIDQIPEADTLNLPDDVDLGDNDTEAKQQESGDLMDEDSEDPEDRPADGLNEESAMDTFDEDGSSSRNNGLGDADEPDAEPDINADAQGQLQASEEEAQDNEGEEPQSDGTGRPDLTSGSGAADLIDIVDPEVGVPGLSGNLVPAPTGNNGDFEAPNNDEKAMDSSKFPEDPSAQGTNPGTGTSRDVQGETPSRGEKRQLSNPLRSLGDALKQIQQRFDEILEPNFEDTFRHQPGGVRGVSQVEYLRPEDADHEMQALGPSEEQQVARLEQLNIVDGAMDVDCDTAAVVIEEPEPEPGERGISQLDQEELHSTEQPREVEGALLRSSLENTQKLDKGRGIQGGATEDAAIDDTNHDVEKEMCLWRSNDYPDESAQRIWRQYEMLTQDLAHTLCEQLRLILEPTLATRLKGDYRTGKRLNMKKVIPYIASDYTKDKIWLRRTKPSQREYQVLISIDDSRSMAESHCIHLAYQTLALITKALSRLESGDIAIAKFGETVDILHRLDEGPFTEQSGTKIISSFRFSQKATDVLSLMETSLKFLENARERKGTSSSSAADLWQLQIIISDGICQDHEKLQAVLRKAEEQRVLVVFIILDSLKSGSQETSSSSEAPKKGEHSILEMKKVDFKIVDGRMELQQKKYLDSFPFEYYVVLRNVETLPEVLAETLKQFFERISEQ